MPTLNWIGNEAVVNHHLQVPFRLLKDVPELACGDPGSGNLIVQGDNLQALKALLPYYAGQVKCIYIDPPYNTGNEGWAYNDNVNSPLIREWLGKTVGKEGETLDRHDRWLCMMYPRLALLRQFLREDGAIFISIENNELYNLKLICDEIFGYQCFIANLVWQRTYSPRNDSKGIPSETDSILVYGKQAGWLPNKLERTEKMDGRYASPDNDPRPWKAGDASAIGAATHTGMVYAIEHPITGKLLYPPNSRHWTFGQEQMLSLMQEWAEYELRPIDDFERRVSICGVSPDKMPKTINAIMLAKSNEDGKASAVKRYENGTWPVLYFTSGGKGGIACKRYLNEMGGRLATNLWLHTEVGHTDEASKELKSMFEGKSSFDTPKPTRLIERILQIATHPGDLVMDSFAGSGTTGHAVLKMNAASAPHTVDAASAPRAGVDAASAPRAGVDAASAPRYSEMNLFDPPRGGDAASTWKTYFDPKQPIGFLRGGNLPHWRQQGATYFVTWRTADSMPAERVQQWGSERSAWLERHPEPHDTATQAEYDRLFPGRWDQWLDESLGACELQKPEIHALVETALRSFDNDRYRLEDLAIMPNHVHVLVTPLGEHTLSDIVQGWKSYTAHAINERLGRKGNFWQKENFDHIVRNADEMSRLRDYVRGQQGIKRGGDAASTLTPPRGGDAASTANLPRGGDAASTKSRRFILVEMEPKIAREVTAERVRRVAQGYTNAKGVAVEGLGGGFRYCELGEPFFDETGMIRETVKFSELARHVYFSETGEPLPRARVLNAPLIGECNGVGVYLLYNGILGDDSVNGGNVLTRQTLAKLPPFDGPKIVYCAGCLLSRERQQAERITVRQTPYEIKLS